MSRTAPLPLQNRPALRRRGFTMMAMLFILVALAALGAALASLSMRQHMGSASELGASRAYQAAFAGLEWASFQVLRNPAPPAAAPACFANTDLALPDGLAGFTVSVRCTRTPPAGTVSDGATDMAFYDVVATACNMPTGGACPNAATSEPAYVERQLTRRLVR